MPTLKNSLIYLAGYRKIFDNKKYKVYRTNFLLFISLKAVWFDIYVYTIFNRYVLIVDLLRVFPSVSLVKFSSTSFPGLIKGSKIMKIIVIPWSSLDNNLVSVKGWRCNIFTTKCQIYYNFAKNGCQNSWRESVVWDLPGRRYPSKELSNEIYFTNPFLPKEVYVLHPAARNISLNQNDEFDDHFKYIDDSGEVFLSRFYFHKREAENNPFFYMGGFESSNKLTIIGTYRSNKNKNTSSRICIFISTDGGRSWFNKFEFACNEFQLAFGNSMFNELKYDDFGEIKLRKRKIISPSDLNKNPDIIFEIGAEINVKELNNYFEITTFENHNLQTGDVVFFYKNSQNLVNDKFDFILNNTVSSVNAGNGIFWQIEVLSNNQFKIFEYIHNPYSNITARHVHAINKIKDGFIISAGDIYPQGWIYFLQIKKADTYDIISPIDKYEFLRLTSSENSVQRTMGTILFDDLEQTVIFASDEAHLRGKAYQLQDFNFSRSSTGIYKGRLSDIDDFSQFKCIFESSQVAYFFKQINNLLIFAGQENEVAFSSDNGDSWFSINLPPNSKNGVFNKNKLVVKDLAMQYYLGIDSKGSIYLHDLIITKK
jgi:hypothetical protein